MAKIIDYPRATLQNALQLAEGIAALGGACKAETAAEKTGRKISGAFHALVSSAVRYGLISSKNGMLSTLPLYRSIKLAYNEEEKNRLLVQALLSPPLFKSLADRFDGLAIPSHFEKLLIREFNVPEEIASRVEVYFVQGAKMTGLISVDGTLRLKDLNRVVSESVQEGDQSSNEEEGGLAEADSVIASVSSQAQNDYSISFKGPGLNSTILISELDDLIIVEAILAKVKKKLEADL